jgi:hypothetical protein
MAKQQKIADKIFQLFFIIKPGSIKGTYSDEAKTWKKVMFIQKKI